LPLQTSTTRDVVDAWHAVLDAAGHAESLVRANQHTALAPGADGRLHVVEPGHPDAVIAWRPHAGFEVVLPPDDPRHAMIDLYLPICSATDANPITVGHLGQSLDGFIATHAGESQYVTGEENILHLHRMRALCDAVVVGAGTIAADDPQLTTRKRGPQRAITHRPYAQPVAQGDMIAWFEMGSTVIVIAGPGVLEPLVHTGDLVQMGQPLARWAVPVPG
jgi:hypothetical protein